MNLSIKTRLLVRSAIKKLRFSFEQVEPAKELLNKLDSHILPDGTFPKYTQWEKDVIKEGIKNVGFDPEADYTEYEEIKSLLS